MCRAPVTLGGGMTMVNGLRAGSGSAVEIAALVPECQPALLGFLGVVLLGEFGLASIGDCSNGYVLIRSLNSLILERIHQRQPACLDDVLADADRAPDVARRRAIR